MSVLQYNSYELSSDKFKRLDCAMCLKNGDYIDTLNFCVECESYFCSMCLKDHLKSKSTDWLKYMKDSGQKNNVTGQSNHSQLKRYGTEANTMLPYRTNIEKTGYHQKTICDQLQKVLQTRKGELQHLQMMTDTMIAKMKDVQVNMMQLVEDFVARTEQALVEKQNSLKLPIQTDIDKLEKALKHLENDMGDKCESTRWIDALVQNVTEVNDENGNLQRPVKSKTYSKLHKTLAYGIEDLTYKMNKLGGFVTEDSCSMYLQLDKHGVKTVEDRTTCDINDMCQLDDGTLLLCDWNNTKIKHLNHDLAIKNICLLPSIPWAVCQIGPSEVAVSLFLLERIQFITITQNNMILMSTFKVGEACRGLGYIDNNLIVSCGGGGLGEGPGHLRMYNKSGHLLKVIKEDQSGHAIFSCPFHITIGEGMIYTTDRDQGLICLSVNLKHTATVSNFGLTKGICKGDDIHMFICDFKHGTILLYNTQTMESVVIVEQVNKITGPQSLCYDHVNKILAVASGNSNVICTYQLIEANNVM